MNFAGKTNPFQFARALTVAVSAGTREPFFVL